MSDDPRASSTGRDAPGRFVLSAQELHQRVGRLLRLLFQHPVSGVLQNDDRYVRGHELQLRALELAKGFLTTVNTGIVSFVFESSPKSLWVIGCEL